MLSLWCQSSHAACGCRHETGWQERDETTIYNTCRQVNKQAVTGGCDVSPSPVICLWLVRDTPDGTTVSVLIQQRQRLRFEMKERGNDKQNFLIHGILIKWQSLSDGTTGDTLQPDTNVYELENRVIFAD